MMPIYKKGWKKSLGNCRSVSLPLVLGKVMEQILLNTTMQHLQDNQGVRSRQHRFVKGRSCLTSLFSFYDKVTQLVDEGKAADVVYQDFSKVFHAFMSSTIFS